MPTVPDKRQAELPGFRVVEKHFRVVRNDPVNLEYRLVELEADGAALNAQAGQFFHLSCPHSGHDRPLLRRPMSIYQVDRVNGRLLFLYKVQGAGTRGLASLRPGDMLDVLGPLGHGFSLRPGTRHALLLARGAGLATLAPVADLARSNGTAVTAILSARTEALVMSEAYLTAQGAHVFRVTDEQGTSAVAAVEDLLRDMHAVKPFDFFATCGSNRLLKLLQRLGREWNVAGEVALEQHMGCALGMCYCCVQPFRSAGSGTSYRRVCYEGPVFDLQEAIPWST